MKVENFIFSRELPPGVFKHVINENKVYQGVFQSYTTYIFTRQPVALDEENKNIIVIRLKSNNIVLMLLEFYRFLLARNKTYDDNTVCFVRNIKTDLLSPFFYPLLKNMIPVHHTKEVGECLTVKPMIYGSCLALIELIVGSLKLISSPHIAAVTEDIFDYQCKRTLGAKNYIHYPNGVDFNDIKVALDRRVVGQINFIMVAGNFSEWHGVDSAIIMLEHVKDDMNIPITLHLVGKLTTEVRSNKIEIRSYGYLDGEELASVFDICNFSIGSMNMSALNMKQSASLKTREYLSRGIPVISSTPDIELPDDYPYHIVVNETNFGRLKSFLYENMLITRCKVRDSAMSYVDKYYQGKRLKNRLDELYS